MQTQRDVDAARRPDQGPTERTAFRLPYPLPQAAALLSLVAAPLCGVTALGAAAPAGAATSTAAPDAPATGTAAATATVHVAFSAASRTTVLPTVYTTKASPQTGPTGPGTSSGAVKQGAVYTLETGSGPDSAALHPTSSTCTTDATGACTLTTTTGGSYWVVETSTPKGDAASEPVQVTATLGATVTATVTMVPADCSVTSTGSSGACLFTYYVAASKTTAKATLRTKVGLESLGFLDYSYDVGTHVLTMKVPGTTVPPTAEFDVCYGAVDMTFGLMTNPTTAATRACGPTASGVLPASFAAHETSYSGAPVSHTATPKTKSKGDTVYEVTIPSGAHWYLLATCGGKLLQVADPAATPTPATPTLTTSVSAATIALDAAVTDAATVTGTATTGAPAGTITFTVCGPTSSAQPCGATSDPVGSPVALAAGAAGASTATSGSFTPSAVGTWCFAAVYTPAAGAPYATASDDVSGAPVPAECVTVSAPVAPPPASVAGATTVNTGMPWAGSRPFVAGGAGLGARMVLLGALQRRRYRRLSRR